jgi:hypothetical protein
MVQKFLQISKASVFLTIEKTYQVEIKITDSFCFDVVGREIEP